MVYEEKYKEKIKSPTEIKSLIGARPREKTVIMCHGTFDVVHPGHLRHLMYTKSKADILIASLTSDSHIKKADYRPFVPEALRAINLAAFEMVDYVIIDENETPLKNIKLIEPDYFAKGYEYNAAGINPNTKAEADVVETYGGSMLFTPGDIVYSSSALIESGRPNITDEKLHALMSAEGITFEKLHETLDDFQNLTVHVVGDTIVDTFTYTSMIGGQTKTPTISVRYEEKRRFVGGAGIVAKHLKSAGADVTFTTVLGNDDLAEYVIKDLRDAGVNLNIISDPTRPTTDKNAFICGNYRLLKVDTLDNKPISMNIISEITQKIAESDADCVVFSDFRHGIFHSDSIGSLSAAVPADTYKVADSQVASRWGNILDYQGFDLITPNEREARFSLGDQDSVIRPLAQRLFDAAHCKNMILKLGERGIIGYRRDGIGNENSELSSFFVLDSFATEVVDPVGSGDALLAYASLSDFVSKDTVIAAILGALAAACSCAHDGNYPIFAKEMHKMLDEVAGRLEYFEADM